MAIAQLKLCLTYKVPFATRLIVAQVNRVVASRQIDAVSIVRPRSKLEFAELIVEWKPSNVN
jgi:hypothetical protein